MRLERLFWKYTVLITNRVLSSNEFSGMMIAKNMKIETLDATDEYFHPLIDLLAFDMPTSWPVHIISFSLDDKHRVLILRYSGCIAVIWRYIVVLMISLITNRSLIKGYLKVKLSVNNMSNSKHCIILWFQYTHILLTVNDISLYHYKSNIKLMINGFSNWHNYLFYLMKPPKVTSL